MIYYSKSKIQIWQPNLMMLDMREAEGHIYVTRNTYEQAVLVSDRFGKDISRVSAQLNAINFHPEVIAKMNSILPEPIKYLTPFYNLVAKDVEFDLENIEQLVGVLAYISMNIDFSSFLKLPTAARANLTYTGSILLDYLSYFEDFNFKIERPPEQIYVERSPATSTVSDDVPRSQKRDFDIQEDTAVKEDNFDPDEFMKSLGWDAIPTPEVTVGVNKAEDKPKNNAPAPSEFVTKTQEEIEAENLEAILTRFGV